VSAVLGAGVVVAYADGASVLYVNNGASANCSDTAVGAGSAAAPFCTIQAAANAAGPGDTVDIATGYTYKGAVDITPSGTAAAPIVFQTTGPGEVSIVDSTGQTGPALTFTGASYVEFEGSTGAGTGNNQHLSVWDAVVNNSSHITLDSVRSAGVGEAVEITGTSSDVTITHDFLAGELGGALVTAGSAGDVISTNEVIGERQGGISVEGAANTVIASNTVSGDPGTSGLIGISADSTGTSIENNVLDPTEVEGYSISVDSASAAGSTEDYNVVAPTQDSEYSWAGVEYSSQAAFATATGEGKHDLLADPGLNSMPYTNVTDAPQINSANGAAPGMLATDLYGYPCTANPVVPASGAGSPAYCARGAVQQQYTTTVNAAATATGALSVNLNSTMAQTYMFQGTTITMQSLPTPAVSFAVDWGDGATPAPTPASATDPITALTHTYAKIGTYKITDTAELTDGTRAVTTSTFTTAGSTYTPVGPTRILDTRKGAGAAKAKVARTSGIPVTIAGVDSVPAGVTAVAVHITVTDTTGVGWIAAEADGAGVPGTSSLNYGKGQTISNTVIVPVAANGKIELYNGGATPVDLLADVSGYFAATAPDAYVPITPTRVWDTRQLSGWTLSGGYAEQAFLAGENGDEVPSPFPANATMVANTTVTDAKGSGYLSVYPSGASRPATSNVNFDTGQTIANLAILGTTGLYQEVEVYNGSTGSVDIVFDVFGYFANN
jgi:parallel beta-helix repeat protein